MISEFDKTLAVALDERKSNQRYRRRTVSLSPQNAWVNIDNNDYLAFCSNDYLGLANHPEVVAALQQTAQTAGVGSGASHLVHGHSHHHHQLEEMIAKFTGRDRALLFSNGYMANLGVVSALFGRGDTIYEDRLNHASLIDAGLLSRAKVKRYRHNDMEQLAELLRQDTTSRRKLVVVDGVFSMDGDVAPLDELSDLCAQHHVQLMVDDAHGFGVLGPSGGGCAEFFQLSQQALPILIGTLGKSFGTFGAFVAGSEILIESLIQFARPYIYTTALPPSVASATQTSLSILSTDTERRERLVQNIMYFREQALVVGLPIMDSITPIQPILLGDDHRVMAVANQLKAMNILVGAIRPPTVPEGTGRLRITLNANHGTAEIDRLINALNQCLS